MRLLRALVGSLLWILAGVLGLVGVLASVTIILLPIGIPLLLLARKLFRYSMVFFVPRKARHPVHELGTSVRGGFENVMDSVTQDLKSIRKSARRRGKKARKASRSFVKRQRARLA